MCKSKRATGSHAQPVAVRRCAKMQMFPGLAYIAFKVHWKPRRGSPSLSLSNFLLTFSLKIWSVNWKSFKKCFKVGLWGWKTPLFSFGCLLLHREALDTYILSACSCIAVDSRQLQYHGSFALHALPWRPIQHFQTEHNLHFFFVNQSQLKEGVWWGKERRSIFNVAWLCEVRKQS